MRYLPLLLIVLCGLPVAAMAQARAESAAWLKRCEGTNCEIVQRLMSQQNQTRVLEMAIAFPPGETGARGVIVLPLGVDMRESFTLRVDDGKPVTFKMRYCLSDGCYGFMTLAPDMLASMKKGHMGVLSFQTFDGQPGRLPLSLDGFAAALSALE